VSEIEALDCLVTIPETSFSNFESENSIYQNARARRGLYDPNSVPLAYLANVLKYRSVRRLLIDRIDSLEKP